MKKFICIFLSFIFIISLAACVNGGDDETDTTSQQNTEQTTGDESDNTTSTETLKNTQLALPYNAADGLDPYTLKTEMNHDLTTLLYDSLYKLDSSFSPVAVLADSGKISDKSVTVKIKSGVKFSDSTTLSASDVVYSFKLAKESDNYGEQLENFDSAYAENSKTVVFKLSNSDIYALNCLTFPIVKSGSSADGKAIGSGRYYLSSGKLKANKNHVSGEKASISKISLFNIKNSDDEFGCLQIGEISFAYKSLSDCNIERIVAATKDVPLNNLVYIGMKSTKGLLKDSKLRRIISCAVNKTDIADTAFNGYSTAATTPFNPHWKEVPSSPTAEYSAQDIAKMLDESGYAYQNNTDKHRKNSAGKDLILTLAVNKDNDFKLQAAKMIQSDLQTAGIEIQIIKLDRKELKKAARKGKYDMYIGEIKLCGNMSLSPFFDENGSVAYYIDKNLATVSAYNKLVSGKIKIEEFVNTFNIDIPFVPLCYREGLAAISNTLEDNVSVCEGDLFSNIYEWKFK